MYVIMGGTGHVGSAVAQGLLDRGEAVTIVTHDASHADGWRDKGAEIAEADVEDVASLHAAFARGRRAFLLNPPADVSGDTDVVERRTAANIVAALDGLDLEKVVAASAYGAQPGERIGDLSVLWQFEQALRAQPIPAAINRGAYYMSNWDEQLDAVRKSGKLSTMLPVDTALPMVAPADLGAAAVERLLSLPDDIDVRYVEGPARYSPNDVAAAFAKALGRAVEVEEVPRDAWFETYQTLGFSGEAADAYARMTAVSIDGGFDMPDDPWRGSVTLQAYIDALVQKGGPSRE